MAATFFDILLGFVGRVGGLTVKFFALFDGVFLPTSLVFGTLYGG